MEKMHILGKNRFKSIKKINLYEALTRRYWKRLKSPESEKSTKRQILAYYMNLHNVSLTKCINTWLRRERSRVRIPVIAMIVLRRFFAMKFSFLRDGASSQHCNYFPRNAIKANSKAALFKESRQICWNDNVHLLQAGVQTLKQSLV